MFPHQHFAENVLTQHIDGFDGLDVLGSIEKYALVRFSFVCWRHSKELKVI